MTRDSNRGPTTTLLLVLLGMGTPAWADPPVVTTLQPPDAPDGPDALGGAPRSSVERSSAQQLLQGELEYGRRLIGLARPKAGSVREAAPFQNAYAPTALDGPLFYETLGRPDLASSYKSRRAARIALPIVGGAVALGGLLTMSFGSFGLSSRGDTSLFYGGGVMFALGMSAIFTSMFLPVDPLSVADAQLGVDEYNRDLRRQLRLPPPELLRAAPPPPLSVAPWIGPQGGGVAMALRF